MKLRSSIYIAMILFSNLNLIKADEVQIEYSMDDEVLSCSGWLASIIFNICNNTYRIIKRDTSSVMIEKMAPRDLQVETNKQRLVDDTQWRRMRRQVVSECCMQPCRIADIISYCPSDAKLLIEHPDLLD